LKRGQEEEEGQNDRGGWAGELEIKSMLGIAKRELQEMLC